MHAADTSELIHASAVAVGTAGVLITGKSGSGKSGLALSLIALGAELVSDDQVMLTEKDGGVLMSAPSALRNRIEARGVGILNQPSRPAWVNMVVDLDRSEKERLPEHQEIVIAGRPIRLLRRVESAAFPSILYLLLHGGLA